MYNACALHHIGVKEKISGIGLAVLGMCMMIYAYVVFRMRAKRITLRNRAPLDDPNGTFGILLWYPHLTLFCALLFRRSCDYGHLLLPHGNCSACCGGTYRCSYCICTFKV